MALLRRAHHLSETVDLKWWARKRPPYDSAFRLLRIRHHRAHRIAFAEQRAGAGHHDVAFDDAVADLDLACRHQSGFDPPRLDALAPYHLHHGAGGAIEDGGQRHRDAAALAGLDLRPPGRIHQQLAVGGDADEDLAELAVGLDGGRQPPHPAVDLAGADHLDPRGLIDLKLCYVARRHQPDQVEFAARDDGKQRLALARSRAADGR